MEKIIQRNVVVKSSRRFESIKLGFCVTNEVGSALLHLACRGTYSPIEMYLTLGSSNDVKSLLGQSLQITHEEAARTLRSARSEQRNGGDNINEDINLHTEKLLAPLVLAHLLPSADFSLANLQPHTIDTLKILALYHETSDMNLFREIVAA